MRLTALSVLVSAACWLLAAGCQTLEEPETADIVSVIPWGASEERTYRLYSGDDEIGKTTLTVERVEADGSDDFFRMTQRSEDDEGNLDTATVDVETDSLKPLAGIREIVDADRREVAASCYEYVGGHSCDEIDAAECDDGIIVGIEERVYEPPDEEEPDIPRRAPMCVPEHSYDNDTSLFIWRTIAFEERFEINYTAVLTGVRDTQTVRISVLDRVDTTPIGERDAWYVQITGDGKNQYAWFSADDERVLLAYQNDDFTFELME
jgi:hypothetical protein